MGGAPFGFKRRRCCFRVGAQRRSQLEVTGSTRRQPNRGRRGHGSKPRTPCEHPNPTTKVGSKLVGEFTYPEMGSQNGFERWIPTSKGAMSTALPRFFLLPLPRWAVAPPPASCRPCLFAQEAGGWVSRWLGGRVGLGCGGIQVRIFWR